MALDAAGNLYLTDLQTSNEPDINGPFIEKYSPTGVGTDFASLDVNQPGPMAIDAAGNVYVDDYYNDNIEKITPDGTSSFLPGAGADDFTGLACDAAGNLFGTDGYDNKIFKFAVDGTVTVFADTGLNGPTALAFDGTGNLYVANSNDNTLMKFTPDGTGTLFAKTGLDRPVAIAVSPLPPTSFFDGEVYQSNGAYYLSFPGGTPFGYYYFLADPHYLYHFDLGYEYVFDAADGKSGVYLYDFKSSTFFYTSPTFPFPYLYDFSLNTVLYYYPDPDHAGHYNTGGVRYFYDIATGKIISK